MPRGRRRGWAVVACSFRMCMPTQGSTPKWCANEGICSLFFLYIVRQTCLPYQQLLRVNGASD